MDNPPDKLANRAALVLGVGLLMLVTTLPCQADFQCPGLSKVRIRPQDQVYMVNLRPAGCTTRVEKLASRLRVTQCMGTSHYGRGQWTPGTLEQITAWHDPSVVTIVYVHGNRVESNEAAPRGLFAYHRLVRCQNETPPLRFVILSWSSDQVKGPLRDYRLKAARAEPVAWEMAWLVNQLPSDLPIGFVGFSYGARVASGALHILGGGKLNCRTPRLATVPRRPIRAAYIAAALDADWLGTNRHHGRAMSVTEQLLMSVNQRDPAMRFYGLLYKGKHPDAMGYSGPTCLPRGTRSMVKLYNVNNAVGRSHELCRYVSNHGLMSRIWKLMSFEGALEGPSYVPQELPSEPVLIHSQAPLLETAPHSNTIQPESLPSGTLQQGPQVVDPASAL